MKDHKGFLLIELMISLTILTITLGAYGHFFVYIGKIYQLARNKLIAMQHIQNNIERYWLQQKESIQDTLVIQTVTLPLPHIDISLTNSDIHLVYKAFQVTYQDGIVVVPGYIYEV